MFICRQQLLRASTPRYLSLFPAARRFLPDNRTKPYAQSHVGGLGWQAAFIITTSRQGYGGESTKAPALESADSELDTREASQTPVAHAPLRQAASAKPVEGTHKSHKALAPPTTPTSPPDVIHDFPALCNAIQEAIARNHLRALLPLVRKHWNLVQSVGQEARGRLLYMIIKSLCKGKTVHTDHLLNLLQLLETSGDIRLMTFASFSLIINGIVYRAGIDPQESTILPLITRVVLSKIHQDRGRRAIWILFAVMRRYLQLGQHSEIFSMIQSLVEGGYIPNAALEDVDLSSRNFRGIVLTVQLRCIAHWGWAGRSLLVLNDILASPEKLPPMLALAMVNIVNRLLVRLDNSDLIGCTSILVRLLAANEDFAIPEATLDKFYLVCKTAKEGELARTVYKLTREKKLLSVRKYPPPAPNLILWYMDYFASVHDEHAARLLTADVVDDDIPIPYHDRCAFISHAASFGFTSRTKALWDKYGVRDRDADLVAGNSAVMLRVVSLCRSHIRLLESKRASRGQQQVEISMSNRSPSNLPSQEREDIAGSDITTHPTFTPHPTTIYPRASNGDEHGEQQTNWFENPVHALRSFADQVIEAYRLTRLPLENAAHNELNALARAYFLMDRVIDGFRMFSIMLDRREIPDVQDVNVMLSAMARYDPQRAASMLGRMVQLGLRPDAVSFGTVIHCAILHRQMGLVRYLIGHARDAGIEHLTYKTMGSLIRACIRGGGGGETDRASNLRRLEDAQDLIHSLLDSNYMPSPAMGEDCIVAALRAEDPMTAFEFWQILIKDRTEWNDKTQYGLRADIANAFIRLSPPEWLQSSQGDEVLRELGHAKLASSLAVHTKTKKRPSRD